MESGAFFCYTRVMSQSILVAIFSVVVLLAMAGTFLFFYLRSVRSEVYEYWLLLMGKLHLRLDKIPNLIETMRRLTTGQEALLAELVRLRSESWKINEADKRKVQTELALSNKLGLIWSLRKQLPELNKDTNFLALRMEFKQVSKEIEAMLDGYNEKVRSYNGSLRNLFFLPFVLLFPFRKLAVFEFES